MIDFDWRAEISTEDGPLRCVLQHCCDGLWRWFAMRGGPALAVGGSAHTATEALHRHYRADVWNLRLWHNDGAQIWP